MTHEEENWKEDIKMPKGTGSKQQSEHWRVELARALSAIGKRRKTNPMERVANLFYDDDGACLGILRFMLPQLKSVEADIKQQTPFKLVIDLSPEPESGTEDGEGDDAGEK